MKNLLVADAGVKYGSSNGTTTENAFNAADLALGSIGIFGVQANEEVLITETKATAAGDNAVKGDFDGKSLRFAVGAPNGAVDMTGEIDVAGVVAVKGFTYAGDYTFAKNTLTVAPKASPTDRDAYLVKIAYRDEAIQQDIRVTISAEGNFGTATALCNALRARMLELDIPFAGSGTSTLIITSTSKDIRYFSVAVDGDFASSSVVFTDATNESIGDPYFLKELEKELLAYKGTADQIISYIPKLNNQVEEGQTYNVYMIEYKNARFPKGSQKHHFDVDGILYIATPVETSVAGNNALVVDTILNTLLSSTRLTANPV